jgi:putative ABC transport system substrate-binding protein
MTHLLARRRFMSLAAAMFAGAASATQAQPQKRVFRIASLELVRPDPRSKAVSAFYEELAERGFVEGKNLTVERRDAAGQVEQLPQLARELLALQPDVMVASGPQASRALKDASLTIPIVMVAVADPVALGLVASLSRPGGNVTGVTTFVPEGFGGKGLQLLHEAIPSETRIATLINPTNQMHRRFFEQDTLPAAKKLGIAVRGYEVGSSEALQPTMELIKQDGYKGLVVLADPLFNTSRVPELSARLGLATLYLSRGPVAAGGLMSYGPNFNDIYKRAATYVAKVLNGARPADLPVEQPTKFSLVINLNAAAALGVTLPQRLLSAADELIQ